MQKLSTLAPKKQSSALCPFDFCSGVNERVLGTGYSSKFKFVKFWSVLTNVWNFYAFVWVDFFIFDSNLKQYFKYGN